jgi:hypothetical protein
MRIARGSAARASAPREVRVLPCWFLIARCLVLAALLAATPARAADPATQIWLVSTRDLPQCGDLDAAYRDLAYWRLDGDCQWSPTDAAAFQASDQSTMPTVVFIHGNQTDADEAVTKAWCALQLIHGEAAGRPFRYVIWSWPADRVGRRTRPDVQLKAVYSDAESWYLAHWLDQFRPGVPISLIGHSFGPRIIAGGLHLLAGGELAGRSMPQGTVNAWSKGRRNPVRVMLLAGAMDAEGLSPGGCYDRAVSLVDQLLVTCNECDRVLRWYPLMYGRGGPEAMGFVGPCCVDDPQKLDVVDVSGSVGRTHDWQSYVSAAELCVRWAHYTFLEGPAATSHASLSVNP